MPDRWQEARDRITGDSWADDLARASVSAAQAKSAPKPEHETYVSPVSFRVSLAADACHAKDSVNLRYWSVWVERVSAHFRYEPDGWIVTDRHQMLGKDGSWDYGPRDQAGIPAWLESHAHRTAGLAIDLARKFAPEVTVNGMTAAEGLARHRERNLGCCDD